MGIRIQLAMTLAVVLFLGSLVTVSALGGISLDFGSENYKVMRIQRSFEVVLNEASKRSSPTIVGFTHDGIRVFNADAEALKGRRPDRVLHSAQQLFGRKHGDPFVEALADKHFAFDLTEDEERGTYRMVIDDSLSFTPEEVVAMLLRRAQEMAQEGSPVGVKDVVILVPAFYTQAERQAFINAAKIAGLHVLLLANNGMAAAMSFAMLQDLAKHEVGTSSNVIFYDMGAGVTEVSLINFKNVRDEKKNATFLNMNALAYRWDQALGGRDFEQRLADHLEEVAKSKLKSFESTPRSRARLLKEAHKAKQVLSANTEMQLSVESLTPDEDFFHVLTRDTFNELCADLFEAALAPVHEALAAANLTAADLSGVEIVGGGSRVPHLQELLQQELKLESLGKHLNGDEAMLYGAAIMGGTRGSTTFGKFPYRVRDSSVYPIAVDFPEESEEDSEEESAESKRKILFPQGARLGGKKKAYYVHRDSPFEVEVRYDESELLDAGLPTVIGRYNISGIPLRNEYNYTGTPKIVVQFELNPSGMVEVVKAEAEIVIKKTQIVEVEVVKTVDVEQEGVDAPDTEQDSEADQDSGDSGEAGSDEASDEASSPDGAAGSDAQPEVAGEDGAADGSESSGESEGAAEGEQQEAEQQEEAQEDEEVPEPDVQKEFETKVVKETKRIALKVEATHFPEDLTEEQMSASKAILRKLDREDRERMQKEADRNELESFVYAVREQVEEDDIIGASTVEEREELREEALETADWIYDEGEDAPSWEYRKRLRTLTTKIEKIRFRIEEQESRPLAAQKLKESVEQWRSKLANITTQRNVTQEELDVLLGEFEDVLAWLAEKTAEQADLALYQEAALTSIDIASKEEELEIKVKLMLRRPRLKKPKKEKEPEEEGEAKAAESGDGASGQEEGEEPEFTIEIPQFSDEVEGDVDESASEQEGDNDAAPGEEEEELHDEL